MDETQGSVENTGQSIFLLAFPANLPQALWVERLAVFKEFTFLKNCPSSVFSFSF
ncbi:MAG: hypothetical protein V4599_08265 [Verrucomicrobiota bacterium]